MEDMRKLVHMRLSLLGVGDLTGEDELLLELLLESVPQEMLNACHLKEIPPELEKGLSWNVCGEFLRLKKASGAVLGIDLDSPAAKQITVGDTTTSFAVGEGCSTPEQRLDALIASLAGYGKSRWGSFRRLKW